MTAMLLQFALGGWGLLKKLFALLLRIQLPAILFVPPLMLAAFYYMDARHLTKRAHNAELSADLCAKGRAKDRKQWADATAAARQQKAEHEAIDKHKQEAADARAATLTDAYQRALRLHASAQGKPADLPQSAAPAQGADGPGETARLHPPVCLSDEDANTLIINTARLQASHEWALSVSTQEAK